MPNHVRNVLRFDSLKKQDIDFILNTIANKLERPEGFDDYEIDFDKIIPQPRIESDCPEDCKVNSKSCVEKDKDRPWFDWYEWNNKYWGTKWGAYDCYTKIGKTYVTFVFTTAWSMPYPVIERLHLLGYSFTLKYADEDYGSDCGILTYNTEQGFIHYDESDITNVDRFAKRLWEMY